MAVKPPSPPASAGGNITVYGLVAPIADNALATMQANSVKGNLTGAPANPENVTLSALKASLSLDQVSNTADAAKPISTAVQQALSAKANAVDLSSHSSAADNPHGVTKAQVGLGNVDNTADLNKPVSTLQQTAINAGRDEAKTYANTTVLNSAKAYTDSKLGTTSGGNNKKAVLQSNHTFSPGLAVYCDNGVWRRARADNIATCRGVYVVESVPDGDNFVATCGGNIVVTGRTPNTQYYLSDTTEGLIVDSQPSITNVNSYVVAIFRTNTESDAVVEVSDPLSLELIDPANINLSSDNTLGGSTPSLVKIPNEKAISEAIDLRVAVGGGGGGSVIGSIQSWLRSDVANLPTTWMLLDGTNGLPNQADTGVLAYAMVGRGQIATPIITPAGGAFAVSQNVTISCATTGVTIKYTTNGDTPSRTTGSTYTEPFQITDSCTIKAFAYASTYKDSVVTSAAFTIQLPAPIVTSADVGTNGTTYTIVFSGAVAFGAGGSGGFVATVNGVEQQLSYVSGVGTNTLVLSSNTNIAYQGETVTLAYTQPVGGNGVEDASSSVDISSFAGTSVTNNSTQQAPVVVLLSEPFSATGFVESGWITTGTTLTANYELSAFGRAGNYGMHIDSTLGAELVNATSKNVTISGDTYFADLDVYLPTGWTASQKVIAIIRSSGNTTKGTISLTSDRRLVVQAVGGTSRATTAAIPENTWVKIRLAYKNGTGLNDARCYGAWSADNTFPAYPWAQGGTQSTVSDNGTHTTLAAQILLGTSPASALRVVYDNLRVSDTASLWS